eukprot:PhM_4_TR4301/c1_g1_i1/m.25657
MSHQSLQTAVSYINSAKNIVFLTGAGVSVGAGIPDFRSPGGMYDTLRPQLLTASDRDRRAMTNDPTYVVNRELFLRNPFPYLELRRPFILGLAEGQKWLPTVSHRFPELLKERLRRVYTQNIDGLDYATNIPQDKIVSVHGSLGKISCESCGAMSPVTLSDFAAEVRTKIRDIYATGFDSATAPPSQQILCPICENPTLKPSTVMYGGSLPREFFEALQADGFVKNSNNNNNNNNGGAVDLLIVMGTSLTVSPANQLPALARENARAKCIYINLAAPPAAEDGDFFDFENGDVFLQGECDVVVESLKKELLKN